MGNHVGIEREPASLLDVIECKEENREHEAKVRFNNKNNKNEFGSSLHLWRFFPDAENSQDIKNTPVLLTDSFDSFDSLQCYLILHIFLDGQKYASHPSPTSPLSMPESEVTVSSILSSSSETLTPRGLSNCLEDAFSTTAQPKPSDTGLNYNIYIWNGKDSTSMTRAVAMAKRFELVKALETRKLSQTLFLRGDKVPLTSVFQLDFQNSKRDGKGYGEEVANNHLFQQLLRRDSSEFLLSGRLSPQGNPSSASNGKTSTSFTRLNQIFPENGPTTPPISPSKDLQQGRSKSEGSLKDLQEQATIIKDTKPEAEPEVKKDKKKQKKKKDKKESKETKKKEKRAKLKQGSNSQPSLLTKPGFPSLDLSKKLAVGKLPLTNLKGLDKEQANASSEGPAAFDPEPHRGSDSGVVLPNSSSDKYGESEHEIKKKKLKLFDTECSKITDDLYLGSQTVSADKPLLRSTGITHILNCAGSICPEYFPGEFVYRYFYLSLYLINFLITLYL